MAQEMGSSIAANVIEALYTQILMVSQKLIK